MTSRFCVCGNEHGYKESLTQAEPVSLKAEELAAVAFSKPSAAVCYKRVLYTHKRWQHVGDINLVCPTGRHRSHMRRHLKLLEEQFF
ncbi:hypothetical protein B5X24_HaOG205490 [Helicoverpa armigera]|nr:hypothetical protein B5X24_HaOG205490 [Helicoverpa armigera]